LCPLVPRSRLAGMGLAGVLALTLAACAATPAAMPPRGAVAATITVVERGWHTDICLRDEDAGPWVADLARGFDGARYLCFGFGERRYLVTHDHGVFEMIAALFPSQAALLMTVLKSPPAMAFGPGNVVDLGIDRAGLTGLRAFLRDAVEIDRTAEPVRLGDGPYPGSVFFAATGTYELRDTCNTWTASALNAAGLPVDDSVVFAGGVMRQARRLAARQAGSER
jgi:hypothetical protein